MKKQLPFCNDIINKRKLQDLMYQTFHNYGVVESSLIADRVKNLTFYYATHSGISLNAEDLRVPYYKRALIGLTSAEVEEAEQKYEIGLVTNVERFQKVIDIWNNASNTLKDEVLTYFRESDPLNPLYIMAFSGARGNISQVRQLVGMRGLMADPQGQIIDLPIRSNFREGLKVTEYVISSYGARKGLVDTALRTADSGYLTRRLVDVAQDIIVREEDCLTSDNLSYEDLFQRYETTLSLKDRLIGRVLAEPVLSSDGKVLLAESGTLLTDSLITQINELGFKDLRVRSPLTCKSKRSICRKCYGWHLSYSRLVDLGEAVGIVAAQSIGEPGTQLTMRTFHTGGVFSGDLTKQIRAPFTGTIYYSLKSETSLVRTIHGDKGFKLIETVDLYIENSLGTRVHLPVPSGNILLINNRQNVYVGQILAEIKKSADLLLEEDSKQVYSEISGETFFQNVDIQKIKNKKGLVNSITTKPGLVWVLNAARYLLPKSSELKVNLGQSISSNNILATQSIVNKTQGLVKFQHGLNAIDLKILNFSLRLTNAKLLKENNYSCFQITTDGIEKKFQFKIKSQEFLSKRETVARLIDNTYLTRTGGILCYDIDEPINTKQSSTTKKTFGGKLYWIPEETHVVNVSIFNSIFVTSNTLIKEGTELWPDTYSKLGGLVQLDNVTQELTIKSGELFLINSELLKTKTNFTGFVRPGEQIVPNVIAQKLCYLEQINISGLFYLLVRPVEVFEVPKEKGFIIEYQPFLNQTKELIKFKNIKRIFLKNWENVKSSTGIDLLETSLILEWETKNLNLQPQLEFFTLSKSSDKGIKISLYEVFRSKDTSQHYLSTNPRVHSLKNFLVKENHFVYPNTVIAQIQISSSVPSILIGANNSDSREKFIILLKQLDIKEISWVSEKESLQVAVGNLIRVGCCLTDKRKSIYSGQIYAITKTKILIRLGHPYLISEGTIIRVNNNCFVQRSDVLATLIYKKLKTVDIVQGLPKVEEILEARKIDDHCLLASCTGQVYVKKSTIDIVEPNGEKTSLYLGVDAKVKPDNGSLVKVGDQLTLGQISPHDMLDVLFKFYKSRVLVSEACKLSFKYLQLFLVNEVQRTYLAQGVQISDKHIEVIVKQMTSKVRIEESGDTILLPGEILSLHEAEQLTLTTQLTDELSPTYVPILLGLTKASLNSTSFISAASFQETTRVLTEAAIEGKKDWLNGLKENVIIGRLIPAGTGFNCYEHVEKVHISNLETNTLEKTKYHSAKASLLASRLENK